MARELFLNPPRMRMDPQIPQDRPVYKILDEKGFYGPDDTLHPEGSIIVLHDVPNENMEPMNDMARERMEAYLDELEESARKVAEQNGRHFSGRPRSKEEMLNFASEDARRLQSVQNPNGVRVMGAKMDVSNRIEPVGPKETPEVASVDKIKRAKIETIA